MNSKKNLHICTLCPLFLLLLLVSPAFGLNFDGTLLLSFKYSIINDPLSVLDNWNYNDATPCLWTGVACAEVQNSLGVPDMFRVVSLTLPNSRLLGVIPEYLGFIPHLKKLDLSNNFLNGTLPSSLFNASELEELSLSNNAISGEIPEFVTTPKKNLKLLNLSGNALSGDVPSGLTSLQNLSVVSLRSNYLSGSVPGGIRSFEIFDLSSNLLSGSLPIDFGGDRLKYLNLSSNKISGLVPQEFAKRIPVSAVVDLSFNDLSGEIPEEIALSNQKAEAFAGNKDLCGKLVKKMCTIPSSLSTPPNDLSSANSTSSPAIAAIPKTMDASTVPDSSGTSSAIPPAKGLKPAAIAAIAVVPLAGVGVLAAIFLFIHQKKRKLINEIEAKQGVRSTTATINAYEFEKDSDQSTVKETRNLPTWTCLRITNGEETSEEATTESDSDDQNSTANYYAVDEELKNREIRSLVMVDGETELEMDTLFKASAYVLGSSGAGVVYKAVLQDGTAFAVRRIGESGGGARRLKEFEKQVRAVAKMRHQNLVRVRGFYWGDDEKLVICDYVSNGSLANIGYRKIGSSPYHLPFETRLKIAKGVARGLMYIHGKNSSVHGNIKPSNILLTPDMDPIISDFGLHRLIHGKQSRKSDGPSRHFGSMRSTEPHDQPAQGSPSTARAGFMGCTSPYHAPESLKNLKPNPKWDVYSFGILMLELLTGKVFSDRELGQWTAGSVAEDPGRVLRMADVAIRGDVAGREEAVLTWFKLGFSCASLVPQKRPCMKDAVHVLEKI